MKPYVFWSLTGRQQDVIVLMFLRRPRSNARVEPVVGAILSLPDSIVNSPLIM